MNKTFTQTLQLLVLTMLALLPATTQAQNVGEVTGYVNIYVRVQAVTTGTGRVSVTPPQGGLESYKDVVDFKRTLPVVSALGFTYFNVKARPLGEYSFAGWYIDDGDGVFDINNDSFESSQAYSMLYMPIDMLGLTDDDIYENEADATVADKPSEPQLIVWAFFSNGATAEPDLHMSSMGTVEIDKPINSPGEQVTLKATPNPGYKFEYWKTGYGSQWGTEQPNTVVSYDQEYTFTVQGGEHYYAYFSDNSAPVLQFPEEGGWMAASFDGSWQIHELSDAFVYIPSIKNQEAVVDIVTNDAGQSYLDLADTLAIYDNTLVYYNTADGFNEATLIYGKGTVRFTHNNAKVFVIYDREGNLLKWSGPQGVTINDPSNAYGYHIYTFRPEFNAFVRIGTTDLYADEHAPTSIRVPANTCYIKAEGIDIADPVTDYIPDVIGLTPEAFDLAVAGIHDVQATPVNIGGNRIYTLEGIQLKDTGEKGIYLINGKKVIVNKK